MTSLKNGPQKLLIISPNPFISQSSTDHSPRPTELIFHIIKSRDQTSVLLYVFLTHCPVPCNYVDLSTLKMAAPTFLAFADWNPIHRSVLKIIICAKYVKISLI